MLKRSTAVVVLALLATPAAAGPDSDILGKLGMIGAWAVNCGNPPSNANPHIEYLPSERGFPTRKTLMGDKPALAEMRNVRLTAAGRVAFLDVRIPDGDRTNVVLAIIGESWRSQESSDPDGTAFIKDGKFVSSGGPTLVFKKCKGGRMQ